ncbi:MAG TPA: hypothetical protein VL633_02735 [Bacteroidota bacterium]|jgi:hypothetical protein|nr:hypothetical protein [Bacteroidota bacterium]
MSEFARRSLYVRSGSREQVISPPGAGTRRKLLACLLCGLSFSLIVFTVQSILGVLHWSTGFAILLFGMTMSCTTWGAEQLWYAAFRGSGVEPFSTAGFLARLPFWYMACGIGYTIGMLAAKKLGLIGFYDVPISAVFRLGARTGLAQLLMMQLLLSNYRV